MLIALRAQDYDVLTREAATSSFPDLVRRIWKLYTDPERIARARSFLLGAGLASQDPESFADFTTSLDDLTRRARRLARADLRGAVERSARWGVRVQDIVHSCLETSFTP